MRDVVVPPASRLTLGTFGLFGWRRLTLKPSDARVHIHTLGKTGSGKSYFLANLFLALYKAGMATTLIDPHGDLAGLLLRQLVSQGVFAQKHAFERIIYLDIPQALARGLFLPFNFLDQPYDDHAMAEHVAEAAMRAWPELATGAPTFENILKHSVIALRENNLPLTRLTDLLTDTAYRQELLANVTDTQVVRFFKNRMDQWGKDAPVMKESTLNRADLLTLSPVLRYSLGSTDNILNFRHILDSSTFVIINLAIPYPHARRLLGCLLTVGMEAAALSRADLPEEKRQNSHHLILDEFSQFMAQSAEALTRMLSETRKYNLYCVMAHQNWSQASERLKGALQNVGLEVIMKAGRVDAEYSARLFGSVDPLAVKHTVEDEGAQERSHPTFYPLQEQWERYVQQIQTLHTGQAFIRLPDDSVRKVKVAALPAVSVDPDEIAQVKEAYLSRYFRPPSPARFDARRAGRPRETQASPVPARPPSGLPMPGISRRPARPAGGPASPAAKSHTASASPQRSGRSGLVFSNQPARKQPRSRL
jgi:hypothetical protein